MQGKRTGMTSFDPDKNVGPNGEAEIKLVVIPKDKNQVNVVFNEP